MQLDINNCVISGRVLWEPKVKQTQNGSLMTSFVLETTYGSDSRNSRRTNINVTAFSELAEACQQQLRQGDYVTVQGAMVQNTWEDDSGKRQYFTFVSARFVRFDAKNGGGEEAPSVLPEEKETPPANNSTRMWGRKGTAAPAEEEATGGGVEADLTPARPKLLKRRKKVELNDSLGES